MFSESRNDQCRRISNHTATDHLRDLNNATGIGDNAVGIGNNSAEIGDDAAGIIDIATKSAKYDKRVEWRLDPGAGD